MSQMTKYTPIHDNGGWLAVGLANDAARPLRSNRVQRRAIGGSDPFLNRAEMTARLHASEDNREWPGAVAVARPTTVSLWVSTVIEHLYLAFLHDRPCRRRQVAKRNAT